MAIIQYGGGGCATHSSRTYLIRSHIRRLQTDGRIDRQTDRHADGRTDRHYAASAGTAAVKSDTRRQLEQTHGGGDGGGHQGRPVCGETPPTVARVPRHGRWRALAPFVNSRER